MMDLTSPIRKKMFNYFDIYKIGQKLFSHLIKKANLDKIELKTQYIFIKFVLKNYKCFYLISNGIHYPFFTSQTKTKDK